MAAGEDKPGDDAQRSQSRVWWPGIVAVGMVVVVVVLILVLGGEGDGGCNPESPTGDVAVVREVPSGISRITEAEFEKSFERQMCTSETEEAPEPGSTRYEELKKTAINELLTRVWIRGEAEELGVAFTPKQVANTQAEVDNIAEIKKEVAEEEGQEIPPEAFPYSHKEAQETTELKMLEVGIQKKVEGKGPSPSEAEIAEYYETEDESLFRAPKSWDVRMVVNEDKKAVQRAKKELEEGRTPADWEQIAKKYSSDPTSKGRGGLQKNLTEEALQTPLLFTKAGALVGPFKSDNDWYEYEVVDIKPVRVLTLAEARPLIRTTLKEEKQQERYADFANYFRSKWTSRTHCEPDFLIESCGNYKDNG